MFKVQGTKFECFNVESFKFAPWANQVKKGLDIEVG